MNIEFPSNAPLAQYLAELEGDASGNSLVGTIAPRDPPVALPHATPQQQTDTAATKYAKQGFRASLFMSVQCFAAYQLLTRLSDIDLFADVRDDVLERAALSSDESPTARWLIPLVLTELPGSFVVGATTSLLTFGVAGAQPYYGSSVVHLMLWLLGLTVMLPVAVELVYQLLLARYTYSTLRLINAIRFFISTREELQDAFRLGVDVVKRSELAARGYRLGCILPPIGRLEQASNARDPNCRLQCRRLRVSLRDVNDLIEDLARKVVSGSLSTNRMPPFPSDSGIGNAPDKRTAPSLLVSSLWKRHEMSSLSLEMALKDRIVSDLEKLLKRERECGEVNYLSIVSHQAQTYRALTTMMKACAKNLTRLNSTMHRRRALIEMEKSSKSIIDRVPSEVAAINSALMEFQASCETLKILAFTSQHDIEDFTEQSSALSSRGEPIDLSAHLQEQLRRSRDQIGRIMKQIASDWDHLDKAIDRVAHEDSDKSVLSLGQNGLRGEEVQADRDTERAEARRLAEIKLREQYDAEKDCLVVFTATSTGEKDFDLQALLKHQQSGSDVAATPVPSFMGELQDVLERRQMLPSAPTLEKPIEDDEAESAMSGHVCPSEVMPLPSKPSPPKTVDLQQLLQSRFTAQLTEECFGGDEFEEED